MSGASRLLFIGGQAALARDGAAPATVGEQCRLAWANVEAQLRAAGIFDEARLVEIEAVAAG